MFNQYKKLTIHSQDFKWWIRNLPEIISKSDLKEKYVKDNLKIIEDGKKELNLEGLIKIAQKNGKIVV